MNGGKINEDVLRQEVMGLLEKSVGKDAAREICDYTMFMEQVRDDVEETSAWHDEGFYGIDDVRLAIGRTIMKAVDLTGWF